MLSSFFSVLEKMSLLIACVCHDVDHPGKGASLCKDDTTLALAMRNAKTAVLENHSLDVVFKMLREKQTDILVNLKAERRIEVRSSCSDNCLFLVDKGMYTNGTD